MRYSMLAACWLLMGNFATVQVGASTMPPALLALRIQEGNAYHYLKRGCEWSIVVSYSNNSNNFVWKCSREIIPHLVLVLAKKTIDYSADLVAPFSALCLYKCDAKVSKTRLLVIYVHSGAQVSAVSALSFDKNVLKIKASTW